MQQACNYWFTMVFKLRRIFVAVARSLVIDDGNGGTAPDPLVWSSGAAIKKARIEHTAREVAWLSGPTLIWLRSWQSWTHFHVNCVDTAAWTFEVH